MLRTRATCVFTVSGADDELLGDVGVAEHGGHEAEDLAFPRGESTRSSWTGGVRNYQEAMCRSSAGGTAVDGIEIFNRDLPDAELHLLNGGH